MPRLVALTLAAIALAAPQARAGDALFGDSFRAGTPGAALSRSTTSDAVMRERFRDAQDRRRAAWDGERGRLSLAAAEPGPIRAVR